MKCLRPFRSGDNYFNCGRCYACRINRSQQWAVRLVYELYDWDVASFVTLTYDDEHLPQDFSLSRYDLDSFLDSLRYELKKRNRKFKYYAVGEYGESLENVPSGKKHGRPHYHLILFGLDPSPYASDNCDRELISKCWSKCDPARFMWHASGCNGIDYVNRQSIAYVTGYVQKKLGGPLSKDIYGDDIPPFSVCSQGFGLHYFLENKERYIKQGFLTLNGKKIGIPKYFRDKVGLSQRDVIKLVARSGDKEYVHKLYQEFNEWFTRSGVPESRRYNFLCHWLDDKLFDESQTVERNFLKRRRMYGKDIK